MNKNRLLWVAAVWLTVNEWFKRNRAAINPALEVIPQLKRTPTAQPPLAFPQIFVLEAFFVRKLISVLTTDANEQMYFLTGPKIGPIRVVSRWAERVSLERQSPVFVRASARSVADVLIPIIEQGAELHMIAHSHPGSSPGATTPSSTDLTCLGKLQQDGSPVIGCIVTRDGYVRFFSISTTFHVMVLGTGVKEISKNVFHIARENTN